MSKTLIITGGLGFIGHHFVDWALVSKHRVLCIDKMTYVSDSKRTESMVENWEKLYPNTFTFWKMDINDLEYLPDSDFLINMAAESHVDNSILNQSSFMHTNILGTEHLLQMLRNKSKFNRPVFVHFSTDEVYGDEIPVDGFKETDRLSPSSPYSASKAAADQLILGYCKTFDIAFNLVRPSNVFGENQFPEKLISKNLRHLDRGEKMILYGDGSNQRYFLHVNDLISALNIVLEHGIRNEIYNISGDIIKSNKEVLQRLHHAWKECRVKKGGTIWDSHFYDDVRNVPLRPAEDKIYKIDDSKIRQLGWKPNHTNFALEIAKIVGSHVGHSNSIGTWL